MGGLTGHLENDATQICFLSSIEKILQSFIITFQEVQIELEAYSENFKSIGPSKSQSSLFLLRPIWNALT